MDACIAPVGDVLVYVTGCYVTGVAQGDSLLPANSGKILEVRHSLDGFLAQIAEGLVSRYGALYEIGINYCADIVGRDVAEEESRF